MVSVGGIVHLVPGLHPARGAERVLLLLLAVVAPGCGGSRGASDPGAAVDQPSDEAVASPEETAAAPSSDPPEADETVVEVASAEAQPAIDDALINGIRFEGIDDPRAAAEAVDAAIRNGRDVPFGSLRAAVESGLVVRIERSGDHYSVTMSPPDSSNVTGFSVDIASGSARDVFSTSFDALP